MPTVFLIDCSLSMLQPVSDEQPSLQRQSLASEGLQIILRHMSSHLQLEFSSLLAFSSSAEPIVPWTRDYAALQSCVGTSTSVGDKTDVVRALRFASDYIVTEWGTSCPCQIILLTDCPSFHSSDIDFSFPFPCKLHFVLLASLEELENSTILSEVERAGERLCNPRGSFFVHHGNGPLNRQTSGEVLKRLIETHFVPFSGELCCGSLKSQICLIPPPIKFRSGPWRAQYSSEAAKSGPDNNEFPEKIEICGFLPISELAGPPCMSRHLVLDDPSLAQRVKVEEKSVEALPAVESGSGGMAGRKLNPSANVGGTRGLGIKQERPDSSGLIGSEKIDYGKSPSFRILLHGSLKVENMAALARLGEGWFGVLYSAADTRKKANLMLSVFPPDAAISWLGDLNQLGCVPAETQSLAFPVKQDCSLSYHSDPGVVWMRPQALQLDIQKVLRYARKLPEKQQTFFKDVNKLRKSALIYGFSDILTSIANQLKQDAESMRHSHLTESNLLIHVSKQLKTNRDPTIEIGPH